MTLSMPCCHYAIQEEEVLACIKSRSVGYVAGHDPFYAAAGFLDHSTTPHAPPRESVELRSYCFWEDLEPQEAAMQL